MREVGGGVNVLPLPLDESPPCRPRPHPETGERICRRCRWGDTPRDARRMTGGCTAPTAIFREPAVLRRLPRWWISRSRPDRCGEGGGGGGNCLPVRYDAARGVSGPHRRAGRVGLEAGIPGEEQR